MHRTNISSFEILKKGVGVVININGGNPPPLQLCWRVTPEWSGIIRSHFYESNIKLNQLNIDQNSFLSDANCPIFSNVQIDEEINCKFWFREQVLNPAPKYETFVLNQIKRKGWTYRRRNATTTRRRDATTTRRRDATTTRRRDATTTRRCDATTTRRCDATTTRCDATTTKIYTHTTWTQKMLTAQHKYKQGLDMVKFWKCQNWHHTFVRIFPRNLMNQIGYIIKTAYFGTRYGLIWA